MPEITTRVTRNSRPMPHPASNPGTVEGKDLRRLAVLTRELKGRVRALLELAPGHRVLDIGCGPGLDTTAIQLQVGPDGLVAGIDYDHSMIRQARDHVRQSRQWCRATHLVANAASIPYLDASFDRCYSERMLQHTTNAAVVVSEMLRVTRPGGTIVIADTDWATLSIDTPAIATERALVRFVADTLCNGYAGRQIRRLLTDHGVSDIHVEMWPIVWTDFATFRATSLSLLEMDERAVRAGAVSATELAALYETLADADRRGAFFASGGVVIARGRKAVESARARQ